MKIEKLPKSTKQFHSLTWTAAALFSIAIAYGAAPSAAHPPAPVDAGVNDKLQSPPPLAKSTPPEDIRKDFNDDDLKVKEEKPRGKWGAGLVMDVNQSNDPSVPVVVDAIQSLSGGGKYRGVAKIKRVVIKNRGPKVVSSVQLRWTVASLQDRQRVLAGDIIPFAGSWVEPNNSQLVEIPVLYYNRMLKTLAKNGELYGEFMITIGVQEARFADGSSWRWQESVGHLKFLYLAPRPATRSPSSPRWSPASPPRADPAIKRSAFKPCEAQPLQGEDRHAPRQRGAYLRVGLSAPELRGGDGTRKRLRRHGRPRGLRRRVQIRRLAALWRGLLPGSAQGRGRAAALLPGGRLPRRRRRRRRRSGAGPGTCSSRARRDAREQCKEGNRPASFSGPWGGFLRERG